MTGDLERAFLEFRVHGRPRAMVRVFDLTAQELLLVAGNLARRGEEAEELVQETYLEALRRPEGWDSSRPLLPWLIGILLRKHRSARRQRVEQRGRERELGLAAESSAHPSPLLAAEEADLAQHLDAALRALPETYRDSLTLRLVHGLEPVQIAHALGRPLETVRTQLRRGKELLREALPRSLAALVALDTDGASALRRLVLAQADQVAASTGLAVAGGTLVLMKKLVVATMVLAGAGLFWWRRSQEAAQASPAEPAAAGSVAESAGGAAQGPATRPGPAQASREAVVPGPATTAVLASAELRCRVLWDFDSSPAAGVRLELLHEAFGQVTAHPGATSGLDGLGLFRDLPPGEVLVHADRGGEVEGTLAAGMNELELRIPRGVDVEGVVLDSRDEPVAHAELWISGADYSKGCGSWIERTGADGRFRLRDVQPGRALAARATGRSAEPAILLAGEPGDRVQVTLRVASSGARLRGLVRSAAGEPVPGAVVFIGSAMDTGFTTEATGVRRFFSSPPEGASTDVDGRFAVEAVPASFPLPIWGCAEGFAVWEQSVTLTAPETLVGIELTPAASVAGVVRDQAGNPAASVEVFVLQAGVVSEDALDYGPGWARPRTWSAADGTFRLERLRAGPAVLFARLVHLCEARAEAELVAGEEFRWDARLRRGGDIAGVVRDERGAPLAGLAVDASSDKSGEANSILSAVSDPEGRFRLTGAVRERYLLCVREPSSVLDAPLYLDGIATGTEGLELVFPGRNRASARFEGQLVDASGAPFVLTRLELRRIEPDSTLRIASHAPRQTHGRFTTELLPPGRYVLATSSPDVGRWTIGTFELAAGEVRDIGTHACSAPGSLACEILDAEGAPLVEGEAGMFSEDGEFFHTVKIVDGRGRSGPLQPGVYWIGFGGGKDLPLVRERVEVRSSETAHTTIRLAHALPRWIQTPAAPPNSLLRFLWEWRRDGVLVNRHALVVGQGPQRPREMRLIPGHYEVVLTLEDGRSASTSFDVGPATTGPDSAVVLCSPHDG